MAEIVNLRARRKAQARARKDAEAALNRAAYGQPKAERDRARAERDAAQRFLDAHKRDPDDAAD